MIISTGLQSFCYTLKIIILKGAEIFEVHGRFLEFVQSSVTQL